VKEAVETLDKAWKTCKPEAVAVSALALIDAPGSDDNVTRKVEAWLSEAIEKSPSAAPSLRPKLAAVYWKLGHYDRAETLQRQILAADPDNVESLNNLAWWLVLRDPAKAKESLELVNRAIAEVGNMSTLADTRAVALIRNGQLDQAEHELRAAQVIDPENVSLSLHLAWAYQAGGKTEQAKSEFQRVEALGLKPEARDPLERDMITKLREKFASGATAKVNRG
jgi:Tfp pilus assembly protein PilF